MEENSTQVRRTYLEIKIFILFVYDCHHLQQTNIKYLHCFSTQKKIAEDLISLFLCIFFDISNISDVNTNYCIGLNIYIYIYIKTIRRNVLPKIYPRWDIFYLYEIQFMYNEI